MKKMVKQTFQKLVRKTCENYEDDYFDLVVFMKERTESYRSML